MTAVWQFMLVYGVYHLSLFPSVPGGDSGELLANACNGGTNHPPGYPLFSMLANAAMQFPFPRMHLSEDSGLAIDWNATPAWKVNQQCAFFGALASVLIYMSSLSKFKLIVLLYIQLVMTTIRLRLTPHTQTQ